ncbi:hypothetical protein [Vulgatibacter sp.]|uniref:hypothetical protein n=1 Tax=Vulgatibacter sp. TaxID=1971226 RepID=UPI003561E456
MSGDAIKLILFFGLLGYLFWRNLPGALIFVRPAFIRCRILGGAEAVEGAIRGPAMQEMTAEIEELGFEPLGLMVEQRPLRRGRRELVYGNPEARTFAVIAPVGNEAWLHYVTPFDGGATVITADYHWPSIEEPDYLAGGLPAGSPLEILNTHKRRVQRFVDEGRSVDGRYTLEARAEACGAFYAKGPGRREVRRREVRGVMFTTAALIMVVLTVVDAARR